MASHNLSEIKTLNRGVVVVYGSFAPNGSSAVSASSRKGRGWSVARSNTGLFVVTLNKKFNDLISASVLLQLASDGDQFTSQLGAVSMANRTVEIRVRDISDNALADIAANAGNRINFSFVLSNTTLDPLYG